MNRISFDEKPSTSLSESTQEFLLEGSKRAYSVLCGKNNCGKSYILKTLAERLKKDAIYIGPSRYQNFMVLSPYEHRKNVDRKTERFNQFSRNWKDEHQNIDNSPLNVQKSIAELSDNQREKLIIIMEDLLNSKMEILHTVQNNSMSQKYISVDGHNISYTSSGYRLLVSLITSMLDKEARYILIDEPELGISPETQGELADFIFDKNQRDKYFPHIEALIVATHSTIFLDRNEIENNYYVEKVGNKINMQQVSSINEINQIHFFLLGNRFEYLFLPSLILIVEGKTDLSYIERVIRVKYPSRQVSFFNATGDGRTKELLYIVKSLLGDFQKSPYKGRIFVILDKVHGVDIISSLTRMGLPRENIITWAQNGIEYCYPPGIVRGIFGKEEGFEINDDRISQGGLEYTKEELANKVIDQLTDSTEYPEEFQEKLLSRIEPFLS